MVCVLATFWCSSVSNFSCQRLYYDQPKLDVDACNMKAIANISSSIPISIQFRTTEEKADLFLSADQPSWREYSVELKRDSKQLPDVFKGEHLII